jgi:hypothetical protein
VQDGGHVPGHTHVPLPLVIEIVAPGILSSSIFIFNCPFRLFGGWQCILFVLCNIVELFFLAGCCRSYSPAPRRKENYSVSPRYSRSPRDKDDKRRVERLEFALILNTFLGMNFAPLIFEYMEYFMLTNHCLMLTGRHHVGLVQGLLICHLLGADDDVGVVVCPCASFLSVLVCLNLEV